VAQAEALSEAAWSPLERPPSYTVKTQARSTAHNVKQEIVHERAYKKITLVGEEVASFRPGKCARRYRIVALRKRERITRAAEVLAGSGGARGIGTCFTHDQQQTSAQLVLFIDGRWNQENWIEHLKNGGPAFDAPSNTLAANWMAMAALAWSLKAG